MSTYTKKMREVFTGLKDRVELVGREARSFETDNLAMIDMRIEDTLEELDELELREKEQRQLEQRKRK